MMHSLLKRQIRKYLPAHIEAGRLSDFLNAIEKSYEHYDEKLSMIQRATAISSKELFDANRKLEEKGEKQKKIINSLESALEKLEDHIDDENFLGSVDEGLNIETLTNRISSLALQVTEISSEKDKLLRNLEIRNTDLSNYAHMVSHDLRSPLRNISALLDWILEEEKEKFSPKNLEHSSLLVQNLEKMDRIITGVLQHASIGITQEIPVTFRLDNLIEEIKEVIYVPDNVSIGLKGKSDEITFEKLRLEQLITNLLTNAIKATEHLENGIVEIDLEEKEELFEFTISDNGKGIAPKHQDRIFDMFNKLENDGSSAGIGLALVKKIVQFYQGEISLQSKIDKGTIFQFTLKKQIL